MPLIPGLRYWRDNAAFSQRDLAERAGIHREQISRYENGAVANHATVRKLADALNVLPADLIHFRQ